MSATLALTTEGPAETRRLAARLAEHLHPGDVIALSGELGAGKTCFVQGAARGLGVTARVTSPSFLLRRDYDGRVPVLHLDVYRLDDLGEVLDLGFEQATDGQRVTFIEWGDAMRPLLPADHLDVELTSRDEVDAARRIVLRARGEGWRARLEAVAAALAPWRADAADAADAAGGRAATTRTASGGTTDETRER